MSRCHALLAFAAALASPPAAEAQITSAIVASGFRNPVAVVADPTDRSGFLVVEQAGLVRVVRDGVVLADAFLDLRSEIASGGERGLLGLALAPDYAQSGRLFVNFTNRNGDTVVARFLRRPDDPVRADPATRFDLMWPGGRRTIAQPFANHNGGHLAFGPDGHLYIGLGDGGGAGDPMNHAQNPTSLLGKMLRIDVGVPDGDARGYRVPDDNPFLDGDPIGALGEIWAFGLRNPWRYSFDDWTRGGTGALTLGDVGQNTREEIDFEPPARGGRNYGWRLREGRFAYDGRTPPAFVPLIEPIHDYGRTVGASVTGGLIYRGAALDPAYNGRYYFADYISGRVFTIGLHLDPVTSEATADDEQELTEQLGGRQQVGMVSSFGTDHDGEMLIVNYSAGRLLRIEPDLALVPRAPRLVGAVRTEAEVDIAWEPSPGVPSVAFVIERVRGGAVIERQVVERAGGRFDWSSGDCLRVRGQARSGVSGPPSEAVCAP
jgi:glucose/arabinose dehydrogenase